MLKWPPLHHRPSALSLRPQHLGKQGGGTIQSPSVGGWGWQGAEGGMEIGAEGC